MNVYVSEDYVRGLESEAEDLEERIFVLESEMSSLSQAVMEADRAIHAAWKLMDADQRKLFAENGYVEELLWDEVAGQGE